MARSPVLHWILFGSPLTGSSRIHGYLIHDQLRRWGIASSLLVAPPLPVEAYDLPWAQPEKLLSTGVIRSGDVVVFETVRGPRAGRLVEHLRAANVKTVFAECDWYDDTTVLERCDLVICSSNYLATMLAPKCIGKPHVIPDAVERLLPPRLVSRNAGQLKLAWVGNALHWATLDQLRELLTEPEFACWKLVCVSNHPRAEILWSPRLALAALRTCDVAVVPTADTQRARCKSNNRVTQAMGLGTPVICGQLPAYAEIVESGVNGYVCRDDEDWRNALRRLRDPAERERIGHAGYARVATRFDVETVARQWATTLGLEPASHVQPATLNRELRYEAAMSYSQWYEDRGSQAAALGQAIRAVCLAPSRFPWGRPLMLARKGLRSLYPTGHVAW